MGPVGDGDLDTPAGRYADFVFFCGFGIRYCDFGAGDEAIMVFSRAVLVAEVGGGGVMVQEDDSVDMLGFFGADSLLGRWCGGREGFAVAGAEGGEVALVFGKGWGFWFGQGMTGLACLGPWGSRWQDCRA